MRRGLGKLSKIESIMSEFAVIAQNDESKWDDVKGDLYHYPSRYKGILTPGCKIIYYKGRMRNKSFSSYRLSPEAHYFGVGVIGDSINDPESTKKDRYCEILEYQEFEEAVSSKIGDAYLEKIPESKKSNYWRDGVRQISRKIYEKFLAPVQIREYTLSLPNENNELESYGLIEGKKKVRFSSYYERNPFYRNKAIEIHKLSCFVCGFNFEKSFGELGKGYIHIHHNKPISETGPTRINPQTDLAPLCPNCHAMIHRNKNRTLSIEELRAIIEKQTGAVAT